MGSTPAAGLGGAAMGGEPFQVLRGAQPCRRVSGAAFEVFDGHRGLLVGLYGRGPLRRGQGGFPAGVVDVVGS
ncbi:hypothetical protein GT025_08755 [Streptomyces sp. SID4920]|nr:hypothetical protein [Streptomyces sp. SID4920]MYX64103.1 hypothetical protein [Streptomyces sp. SID8373]